MGLEGSVGEFRDAIDLANDRYLYLTLGTN
jgi:hypothetical protein